MQVLLFMYSIINHIIYLKEQIVYIIIMEIIIRYQNGVNVNSQE